MEVKNGETRKVYVFNHFVVKVAQIYWKAAYNNFFKTWKRNREMAIKFLTEGTYKDNFNPKKNLFGGIMANYHEFVFYFKNRPIFCLPTYITLFGIINIQRRGEEYAVYEDFEDRINALTNNEIPVGDHTFGNPKNFARANDYLQIMDYGDEDTQMIILKYGGKLYQEFFKK